MLQNKVLKNTALGLIGELAFHTPYSAQSAILASEKSENNIIGRAFTLIYGADAKTGQALTVTAGGTGAFMGILAMPKSYSQNGLKTSNALASVSLANGQAVELITSGAIIVETNADVTAGDIAFYDILTGELSFAPKGTVAPDGRVQIPNALIHFYNAKSGFVAVLKF